MAWLAFSVLACFVWIAFLSVILDPDGRLAALLLDRQTRLAPYPFTVQNATWLAFFISLGEIGQRLSASRTELRSLAKGILPEDESTMLRAEDLPPWTRLAREASRASEAVLPRLVLRVTWQFLGARSLAQATAVMNSSLELYHHEIDNRYQMLRYLAWLIPTLGFIGTVLGITLALQTAGNPPEASDSGALKAWMQALTKDLGVAFDTTLLALLLSAIVVFLMQLAQEKEEGALNKTGQYCMDNLINRLYDR